VVPFAAASPRRRLLSGPSDYFPVFVNVIPATGN